MDGRWRRNRVALLAIVIATVPGACAAPAIMPSPVDMVMPGEPTPAAPLVAGLAGTSPSTVDGASTGLFGIAAQQPATSPARIPACTYSDVPAVQAAYDDWAHTRVDTTYRLSKSYVPPDLVPVSRAGINGSGQVRAIVVADLRAMARAARKAGAPLAVRSAYRSYRRQAAVFAGWVAVSGREEAMRFSARPGHSEHQLGTAVDLQAAGGPAPWQHTFAHTRQGRWVARNSWRFGFVISYPRALEAVACYGAEAWHVRYVGREEARKVHRSGLTLREWLWLHED
jgi:zinc D-Ala-D-Ala carboxypeptidase